MANELHPSGAQEQKEQQQHLPTGPGAVCLVNGRKNGWTTHYT